jgi:replicative DNA helicase Mcm
MSLRRATKVWKREAPDRMYRIRTLSGRELEVTPSHPLFVHRAGISAERAEDLQEGQFIAAPRELPAETDDELDVDIRRSRANNAVRLSVPDRMTPGLARLLGYIVADGYVQRADSGSGCVTITNNDREILDDVTALLDGLGLNHSERESHDGKPAREIICGSSEFVSLLESLEPALLSESAQQRVPDAVMRSPGRIKRGFLRAYVDAEGSVSATQREITVASMSRNVLADVRTLLLSFGIESQLHERQNGSYRLRISGHDFAEYVDTVGFITGRKGAAASDDYGSDSNTNTDVVPVDPDDLRVVRETLGLTQADCGLPRSPYQHYERGDRNPSRKSIETVLDRFEAQLGGEVIADGGPSVRDRMAGLRRTTNADLSWDRIESIDVIEPDYDWVYDLEIEGTHTYVSNGVISHNSQMLQYIRNLAPRSVYTSGKGSSSAGLTAAAVRDDFGDGQQWSLEAGALVLADRGIAAVDELDKMRPEDRSAMHEALEQQSVSVSKAGINATLKSRCSLLGAANPKYGRFDQYESIGEQIDLEPALISRFDLIFTVTDQPDPEEDAALAEHILRTNYAGELNTQREQVANSNHSQEEVEAVTDTVDPEIDPELLRKYVAYAKRTCFPTMTDEAKGAIRDFYVDLRAKGADEDAPVPVTARKLEALVRLAEASARVRLSDTVEHEDAERVIEIVRSCLQDIGVDPETGEFDADVIETGTSKSQRDRIKSIKDVIETVDAEYEGEAGAPIDAIVERAEAEGIDEDKVMDQIEQLRRKGDVYSPTTDQYKVV